MLEIRIMIVGFMCVLIATLAGLFWTKYFKVESKLQKIVISYCCGMITLWGIFQIITVPYILLEKNLSELVTLYLGLVVCWCIISFIINRRNDKVKTFVPKVKKQREESIYWIIFGVILFIQIMLIIVLPFADGDDAYYIAVATMAEKSGHMYQGLVYTGGATGGIDIRHSLAPFPIWISVISRVSQLAVTTVAYIIVPVILLVMHYCVVGLLGKAVIKDKQMLPLFLLFIQIINIWSNYSIYTAESFLLTRTSQGKAVIGSIIIPFLILILYKISDDYLKNRRSTVSKWVLVMIGVVAACLCTTLGTVLSAMLVAVCGCCMFGAYRKYSIAIGCFVSIIPAGCYTLLYILFR